MKDRIRAIQKLKDRPQGYSDEWYTPPALVKALGVFDLDPCAGPMKHAKRNWTERGLERKWTGRVWCNPPFSDPAPWVKKMTLHNNGIMLISANMKTAWTREAIKHASAALFPDKKIMFTKAHGNKSELWTGVVLIAFGNENVEALFNSELGLVVRAHYPSCSQ